MAYVELGAVSAGSKPLLKEGSSGAAVALAQSLLNTWRGVYKKGPMLPVNSKFDASFKSAVKSFQRDVGLSVDGKVGPNTWAALVAQKKPLAPAAPRTSDAPILPLASTGSGLPAWAGLAALGVGGALLLTRLSKK